MSYPNQLGSYKWSLGAHNRTPINLTELDIPTVSSSGVTTTVNYFLAQTKRAKYMDLVGAINTFSASSPTIGPETRIQVLSKGVLLYNVLFGTGYGFPDTIMPFYARMLPLNTTVDDVLIVVSRKGNIITNMTSWGNIKLHFYEA